MSFELRGGEIIGARADARHEDRAIVALPGLLEADIRDGRNVRMLPEDLAQAMLVNLGHAHDLDGPIEGEVAL